MLKKYFIPLSLKMKHFEAMNKFIDKPWVMLEKVEKCISYFESNENKLNLKFSNLALKIKEYTDKDLFSSKKL